MTPYRPVPYAEDALEPDLPVIDPHHHLGSGPIVSYGPQRSYLLDELTDDMNAGHNIRATVYVECGSGYRTAGPEVLRPVGETEWVMSQRRGANGALAAIVGFADVRVGAAIAEVIDAHQEIAGQAFAGIRTRATWDPDPAIPSAADRGLLTNDAVRAATRELARRKLVFEAWVYYHQLADLVELAAAQPDLTVVVDHLGSPLATGKYASSRDEVFSLWRAGLRELARQPNVVLKLGGVGMRQVVPSALELTRGPLSSEVISAYWAPEFRHCIDVFGPERCMFEATSQSTPTSATTSSCGTPSNARRQT